MKIIITISIICLLLFTRNRQIESPVIPSTAIDTPLVGHKQSILDLEKILNEYLPKVEACTKKDSVFYPLGYAEMIEDTIPLIAIGRFIDADKIYAVHISAADDSNVTFYCFQNDKWEIIGNHHATRDVFKLEFKDFDGDNRNEIVTSGFGNMNGNCSNDFYYCSPKTNNVKFSGNYFGALGGDCQIDKVNKMLKVEYTGSWYMDNERTIYKWIDGDLIAQKQLVIGYKNADGKHATQFIAYYESPNQQIDSLVLKFRKTYRESDKKMNNLWEHFFD